MYFDVYLIDSMNIAHKVVCHFSRSTTQKEASQEKKRAKAGGKKKKDLLS